MPLSSPYFLLVNQPYFASWNRGITTNSWAMSNPTTKKYLTFPFLQGLIYRYSHIPTPNKNQKVVFATCSLKQGACVFYMHWATDFFSWSAVKILLLLVVSNIPCHIIFCQYWNEATIPLGNGKSFLDMLGLYDYLTTLKIIFEAYMVSHVHWGFFHVVMTMTLCLTGFELN